MRKPRPANADLDKRSESKVQKSKELRKNTIF